MKSAARDVLRDSFTPLFLKGSAMTSKSTFTAATIAGSFAAAPLTWSAGDVFCLGGALSNPALTIPPASFRRAFAKREGHRVNARSCNEAGRETPAQPEPARG
jgi:hypothetical protein